MYEVLPESVELCQMTGHPEELRSELTIKLPVEEVEKVMLARGLVGFQIYAGSGSRGVEYFLVDYRSARKDCQMGCYFEKDAKAPACWNSLIEGISSKHSVVGGWQYMNLYQSWQCGDIKDRFYEERWGRLPPGYRTWTEPVPGPIAQPDRVFIDVSQNPGRSKKLLPQVIFKATAEMWLGPHFWEHAKCTKVDVLKADFFMEKRDTPGYLYLKCWPEPFSRPDGEQGRMQQRLWKLFFHEDCEWPPGSGTICNEPKYGPPELMPKEFGASGEA